jgi:hypothetical protein
MRGKTIPEIINDIEKYRKKRGETFELAKLIRTVLGNIEKDLRFRFVRLTSCYNSVLRFVLVETSRAELAKGIPAIPLYLEMGASTDSMLSFMDLGLSRITARLLQERAANPSMDTASAESWVRRMPNVVAQLPSACQREVKAVLG